MDDALRYVAILVGAILVGLTSAGMVNVIRLLPGIRGLVLKGKKPWACDVCMAFWSTATVNLFAYFVLGEETVALSGGAAMMVSLWALRRGPAPPPPQLEDSD